MAINPFIYEQYDKISDLVCYLGRNAVVKFTVVLSKYKDDYGRQFFHKEFEYNSKNFDKPLITIKREYEYFLSIENLKVDELSGRKEFIKIGVEEFMLFKQALINASKWFTDQEYRDLFIIHKNELIMGMKVPPIELPYLPMGKYITLEPTIYTYHEECSPGVRITLNHNSNFVDLYLNRFMGLVYTISSFNMYLAAQSMLNYIGRPEFGYNLVSFTDEDRGTTGEDTAAGPQGRSIPNAKRSKDFFARMEDLDGN